MIIKSKNRVGTNKSQYRTWQRITACVTAFFFFLQSSVLAFANTVDDSYIQSLIEFEPEFEWFNNPKYLYGMASHLSDQEISYIPDTLEAFYNYLKTEAKTAVAPPKYIPIGVGDITVFIEKYEDYKYIGTPLVQTRFIRKQIRDIIGREIIGAGEYEYPSELALVRDLYRNAFELATLYGHPTSTNAAPRLKFGDRLSETLPEYSPTNSPTGDLIWPEERIINGQRVIVPVVYLSAQTISNNQVDDNNVVTIGGSVDAGSIEVSGLPIKFSRDAIINVMSDLTIDQGGAVLSDHNIQVSAGGDVSLDSGYIQAGGYVYMVANSIALSRGSSISSEGELILESTAGTEILADSEIRSGADMMINAGGTFALQSGEVTGNGDIKISAGSVIAQTVVHRYDYGKEKGGHYGKVASIDSKTGDVIVRSASDISIVASEVSAGDSIRFGADGNIYVGSEYIVESGKIDEGGWKGSYTNVDYLTSSLTAEETIQLIANGQIVIDAADIVAGNGHLEILAGLGITVDSDLESRQFDRKGKFGKKKVTESVYQTVAIRSLLDAGKDVRLHSDYGDITLKSAEIISNDGVSISATGGGVNFLLTTETDHYAYSSVKKSTFTTSTRNRGHSIETGIPNTIIGGVAVEALGKVTVEYEGIDLDDPSLLEGEKLDAQIEEFRRIDGLSWMADVRDNPELDVDWTELSFAYEKWNKKSKSLNAAAIAVISIAVAVATAGAGAGIVGAAGTTQAAVANAAFTTLVNTATIAAGNAAVAGGSISDIQEAAFNAVVSDDGLKSIATSMATAGAIAELDAAFFGLDSEKVQAMENAGKTPLEIADEMQKAIDVSTQAPIKQLAQALNHATVKAGVTSIIEGRGFEGFADSFGSAIANSLVDRVGETLAENIGEAYRSTDISKLSQYLAHAALGCGLGVAKGAISGDASDEYEGNCATGAGGAVVGEVTAEIYMELSDINFDVEKMRELEGHGTNAAQIMAALAAAVAGGDPYIASYTGKNAAEHNALSILEKMRHASTALKCLGSANANICLANAGSDVLKESLENDASILEGMENGFIRQGNEILALPGDIKQLAIMFLSGDMVGLLGAIGSGIVGIPVEVYEMAETLVEAKLVADTHEDYLDVGDKLSDVLTAVMSAGAGKVALIALKRLDNGIPAAADEVLDNTAFEEMFDDNFLSDQTTLIEPRDVLPKTLDQQRQLSILTNQLRDEMVNDFDKLIVELSPAQVDAIVEDPWRMRLFFGSALETRVAQKVDDIVQNDTGSILKDLTWTGRTNAPQDFYDPDGFGFDITGGSIRSILSHQNRPEVDVVISYESIPGDLGYRFVDWLESD